MIGPLAYIGGKRRLAPLLVSLIPTHTTYVEPFGGGCQVFFHKPRSKVEVLNDLDEEVFNFLRICQHHPEELARILSLVAASRRQFELFAVQEPRCLTEVQRAARFYYLLKNSFGGHVARQNYHYCVTKPPNYNPERVNDLLAATAARLQRVQLECSSYEQVLARYDRVETFFYVDPPYVGLKLYRHNFIDDDFRLLADRLTRLKGKFILSINDCTLARDVFAQFVVRTVDMIYTASRTVPRKTELVIANFELPSNLDGSYKGERQLSEGGSP